MCIKVYYVATICAHKERSVKHYCPGYTRVRQNLHTRNCEKRIVMELLPGWCTHCAKDLSKRTVYTGGALRSRVALARYWGFKGIEPHAYPIPSTLVPTEAFTDEYGDARNFVPFQPGEFEDSKLRWEEVAMMDMVIKKRPSILKVGDMVLKILTHPVEAIRRSLSLHEIIHQARDNTITWTTQVSASNNAVVVVPEWNRALFMGATCSWSDSQRQFETFPARSLQQLTEQNVEALGLSGQYLDDSDAAWPDSPASSASDSTFDRPSMDSNTPLVEATSSESPLPAVPEGKGKQPCVAGPSGSMSPIKRKPGAVRFTEATEQPSRVPSTASMYKPLPPSPQGEDNGPTRSGSVAWSASMGASMSRPLPPLPELNEAGSSREHFENLLRRVRTMTPYSPRGGSGEAEQGEPSSPKRRDSELRKSHHK